MTRAISGYRLNAGKGEGQMDGVEIFELWGMDSVENCLEVVTNRTVNPEEFYVCHRGGCGCPRAVSGEFALVDCQ